MDKFHKQQTLPSDGMDESKPMPAPSSIGPYKIESLFSKGGMSILYLASHEESSQPLVVKVLSPKFVENKEMIDRFLKEAQIISITDHPNIVKLFGQGKWEKGLYIAMEFIQGISLRQFIQQRSLSEKRALEIILQVAYALCHLHSHGVIHRDLKPENILITESGEIKVIDFGIAQLHGEAEIPKKRPRKKIIGTPVYMSPEQKDSPENISYNSDIYSLGVITYELLLGRLSHGHIHLSLLPKEIRPIIEKAIAQDPDKRYQDIVDFISDVSDLLKEEQPEKAEDINDFIETLAETQQLLFSEKTPNWPQLEVGIAKTKGLSLTGLYGDFFKLSDNRYLFFMAEPTKQGMQSIIHTSVLRGMVRMIVDQNFSQTRKEIHPVTLLSSLNEVLSQDAMEEHFALSFLLLNPERDQLSFVSCGHNSLYHIPEGSEKSVVLTTPNQPLGSPERATIVETASNWEVGDRLVLFSFGVQHPQSEEKRKQVFQKEILDNMIFSCSMQAKKVLEKTKETKSNNYSQRSGAIVTLERIF